MRIENADRIGLIGDTHGNMGFLIACLDTLHQRGVRTVVQLGDFGFLWPGGNWANALRKIEKRLAHNNQYLYFLDGNHEWFDRLYDWPLQLDGLRYLTGGGAIMHMPRGWRTTLASGKVLGVLGGAGSVDYPLREVGKSWWIEEAITEDDLQALGEDPVDILFGHEAPPNPKLDVRLLQTAHLWSPEALEYTHSVRQMFWRGVENVQPELIVGGHHHAFYDWLGPDYRNVILDRDITSGTSVAVLNVHTGGMDFMDCLGRYPRLVGSSFLVD